MALSANASIAPDWLAKAIEEECKRIFDGCKAKMLEDFDSRRSEFLAGISLQVMKGVSMQRMGENLIVTIKEVPNQ